MLYESLRPYTEGIDGFNDMLAPHSDSIYTNGRQVFFITLKGDK